MPNIDPQISGIRDDGGGNGVHRAELVRGELVKLDLHTGWVRATTAGSGVATPSSTSTQYDADGGNYAFLIQAGSSSTQSQHAGITFNFYGRALGIRYKRESTVAPFSVVVDGVAYGFPNPRQQFHNIFAGLMDGDSLWLVADDLRDDICHTAQVWMTPDGVTAARVDILGILVERRVGYQESTRVLFNGTPTTLGTSAASISLGASTDRAARGIRKIMYCNTTASPVTVTIKTGSTAVWSRSVPANDVIEFDPGGPFPLQMDYTHLASAAASVNATVYGPY